MAARGTLNCVSGVEGKDSSYCCCDIDDVDGTSSSPSVTVDVIDNCPSVVVVSPSPSCCCTDDTDSILVAPLGSLVVIVRES